MKLYRLETEDGRGPYGSGPCIYSSTNGLHGLPVPGNDPELSGPWYSLQDTHRFSFCFQSLELLFVWFKAQAYQEEATEAGYRISVIEATGHVIHGTFQSVFETAYRTTIQRLTFDEAYRLLDRDELVKQENIAEMFGRTGRIKSAEPVQKASKYDVLMRAYGSSFADLEARVMGWMATAKPEEAEQSAAPPKFSESVLAAKFIESQPSLTRRMQRIKDVAFSPELSSFSFTSI